MIRSYTELCRLHTFDERLQYLELHGFVGDSTFGYDRYLNQAFYNSREWRLIRDKVITRDNGCDLGIPGEEITGLIIVHHMNPLVVNDFVCHSDFLLNPEYLISVSDDTHRLITYGQKSSKPKLVLERSPNDTCPWRNNFRRG